MGITVAEALTVGALGRGRVLAGTQGLANVIDHVCVLEQPPYRQWLRPNEFMLTTFFCLKDDIDGQVRSVEDLAEAGAAALAIHMGNFGYKIPDVLLKRADQVGLPLIELPSDISYVEVITPLMAVVLDRQNYLLHRSEEIHNRLIDLVLGGGDLKSLVDTLAGLLRRQVVLSGSQGEILQVSSNSGIHPYLAKEELSLDSARVALSHAFRRRFHEGEPFGTTTMTTHQGNARVHFLPVRLGKSQWAMLCALDSGQIEFDPMDSIALRQGVLAVSVVMLKERAVTAAEQRMRNGLFRELLSEGGSTRPEMLERARNVGWDLANKHVVAILSPEDMQAPDKDRDTSRTTRRGVSSGVSGDLIDRIYFAAVDVVKEYSPLSIVIQKDGLVVLLPHSHGEFRRESVLGQARRLIEAIQERCVLDTPCGKPVGAIGRVYESLNDLSKSYDEACRALSLRRSARLSQVLVQSEELAVFEVLGQLLGKGEHKDALLSTIEPLIKYDRNKGSELVRTIECYFDCGQHIDEAAHRLDLHPNTVKYRLRRAQEILGFDLFQPNYQMTAHLATKLTRMV
jgi:PucR family transcriptional regulator, purine catabolism regulatory protein